GPDSPPSRRSSVSCKSDPILRHSHRDLHNAGKRRRSWSPPAFRLPPPASGFTLIELLVTIAIIATLAAIIAPALFGNVGEARKNAVRSQIQILSLALDAYRLDNDLFPTTEQGLDALRTFPVSGEPPQNWK